MKKILTISLLMLIFFGSTAYAKSYRAELNAGSSSVDAGFDAKYYIANGYMKVGLDGIYVDKDSEDYLLGDVKFMVGSETLYPGLQCDLGFKAILGTAEEDDQSGDIGALAFAGRVAFVTPEKISPIPIEVWTEITGAPTPLSFLDLENYFEFEAGIGVYVVPGARISVSYRYYQLNMEDSGDDWQLDDDMFMLGLAIEF
jgi:YfaZ precursor